MLGEIRQALMKGRVETLKELVQSCLDGGVPPEEILDQGLLAAMAVVGDKFKNDEMFMPEVMIAARAMNGGLEVLDPILAATGCEPRGKVLLGTVRSDLHDVGKNMVSVMFRGAGYAVTDLGVDVAEERFVEAIREHHPDIVALSALLTLTLPNLRSTIQAIERAGLREQVVIMVGGAPVTESFAAEVGSDGWARDAASAVTRANELLAARRAGE